MERVFSIVWTRKLSASKGSGCKAPLEIWGSSGPTQSFAQSASNSRKRHSLIPAMEFSSETVTKKRKVDHVRLNFFRKTNFYDRFMIMMFFGFSWFLCHSVELLARCTRICTNYSYPLKFCHFWQILKRLHSYF